MRLFTKRPAAIPSTGAVCTHDTLVPRWPDTTAMWQERPASGFTCRDCAVVLSPLEARLRLWSRSDTAYLKGA